MLKIPKDDTMLGWCSLKEAIEIFQQWQQLYGPEAVFEIDSGAENYSIYVTPTVTPLCVMCEQPVVQCDRCGEPQCSRCGTGRRSYGPGENRGVQCVRCGKVITGER